MFTKEINIIKRDGHVAPLDVSKVKKIIEFACQGIEVDHTELEIEAHLQFRNNMKTTEIQKILITTAAEMVSKDIESLKWLKVAKNILLYEITKDAMHVRNYEQYGYGDFCSLLQTGLEQGIYDEKLKYYSKEEIQELAQYLKPERDQLFTFAGLHQVRSRYLINPLGELPQEMLMLVSMFLGLAISEENRMNFIKNNYDKLSKLDFMLATPSLSARKANRNLASCNVLSVDDNIESILDSYKTCGLLSKGGAGVGSYWGRVRGTGSEIKGMKGLANNIVSWLRILNDIAVSIDQLGTRKGAISATLDIWHIDIYDFLNLKREAGDEKLKAHDIFPAVSIPDMFLKRVENNQEFTLFDPYSSTKLLSKVKNINGIDVDGKNLCDFWGEEFETVYEYLEAHQTEGTKKVPSLELTKFLIAAMYETGSVFIYFRDITNKVNPNKHKGIIECSNLCTEIAQNTAPNKNYTLKRDGTKIVQESETEGIVQCNLASLNLVNVESDEQLETTVKQAITSLNCVIDMQCNTIPEAEFHNEKYRAIGLGTGGYQSWLVKNDIPWESEKHLEEADKLYEKIAFYSIKASMEIARDKGKTYEYYEGSDWQAGIWFGRTIAQLQGESKAGLQWLLLYEDVKKYGLYNGYLMAIAPTASISLVLGVSPGIDPVDGGFYIERNADGNIPVVMPFYETKPLMYKSRFYIDPTYIIKANAVRQRWIDQAQSMNLFLDRSRMTGKIILDYIQQANKSGIKSIYYIRSKRSEDISCVNCES